MKRLPFNSRPILLVAVTVVCGILVSFLATLFDSAFFFVFAALCLILFLVCVLLLIFAYKADKEKKRAFGVLNEIVKASGKKFEFAKKELESAENVYLIRTKRFILCLVCLLAFIASFVSFDHSFSDYSQNPVVGYYDVTARVAEVNQYKDGLFEVILDRPSFSNGAVKMDYPTKKLVIYAYESKGDSEEESVELIDDKTSHYSEFSDVTVGDVLNFNTYLYQQQAVSHGSINTYPLKSFVLWRANVSIDSLKVVSHSFSLVNELKNSIKTVLSEYMKDDAFAVSYTLLVGNSRFVEDNLKDAYRNLGIAHIFAVSGLHVGFLTFCIVRLLKKLRLPYIARYALTVITLAVFSALCGFSPSVLRAVLMAVIYLSSKLFCRKVDILNSLSVAVIVILLISPIYLFDVGFVMSVVCVLSISLLAPTFKNLFDKIKFPAFVSESLSVSLSSQIGLIPVIAAVYNSAPIISFVFNLVLIPLVAILYIALFVSCILTVVFGFFGFSLTAVGFAVDYFCRIVEFFNEHLGITLTVFGMGALAIILFYAGVFIFSNKLFVGARLRVVISAFCISLCVAAYVLTYNTDIGLGGDSRMIFLDTNQPYFVFDNGECSVLVDASKKREDHPHDVVVELRKNRVRSIDCLVVLDIDAEFVALIDEITAEFGSAPSKLVLPDSSDVADYRYDDLNSIGFIGKNPDSDFDKIYIAEDETDIIGITGSEIFVKLTSKTKGVKNAYISDSNAGALIVLAENDDSLNLLLGDVEIIADVVYADNKVFDLTNFFSCEFGVADSAVKFDNYGKYYSRDTFGQLIFNGKNGTIKCNCGLLNKYRRSF